MNRKPACFVVIEAQHKKAYLLTRSANEHMWRYPGMPQSQSKALMRLQKRVCTCLQSDQSLRCAYETSLHHWLSKMRPVIILIGQQSDQNYHWANYHGNSLQMSIAVQTRLQMSRNVRNRYGFGRCCSFISLVRFRTLRLICKSGTVSDVVAYL